MNPKIKLALINHFNNRGFAVPLALAIGLVMILAGATMLVRSQGDQEKVTLQRAKAQGLSATEVSVARYQDLINNNRLIAMYPSKCDTANPKNCWEKANDTTTPPDFKDYLKECKNGTWQQTGSNIATLASANWQNIDASDASKGQFRLVSYTYAPASGKNIGEAPGTGTLIIEGRVNQSTSDAKSNSESVSRIEVKIPIIDNFDTLKFPGLWLKSAGINNNRVQANVLANDCAVTFAYVSGSGGGGSSNQIKIDTSTDPSYTGEYTTMQFPELPYQLTALDTFPANNKLGTLTDNTSATPPTPTGSCVLATASQKREFPRVSDTANANGVYEYAIDDINGANITIRPSCKVIFHLKNNINKDTKITHSCTNGSTAIANCKPTDFQIFGYKNTGGSICLNGTQKIEAFILAPNYQAGAKTGGGIKGGIWTNSWSNGNDCVPSTGISTSIEVVVQQTGTWSEIGNLRPKGIPPSLANVSSWEQKPLE